MKKIISIASFFLIVTSCIKLGVDPKVPPANFTIGGGVLFVDEGNFRSGNGSLSFYSYDSSKVFNDLFYEKNQRPLGDVPNSIALKEDKIFIIVNNSGKIEVIDQATAESKATISGLISPRNMAFINDNKAYVTSLYSDSLAIINLSLNSVSGYINLRRTSETIAVAGNEAFIANWVGGKEIMVVNTLLDKVVDSIEVGIEPESITIDRKLRLWVLSNGGWSRENFAKLQAINISTHKVEKTYVFPNKQASPTSLTIDGIGQTLFYLEKGVRQMDIEAVNLPGAPLIPEDAGSTYYKLAVNPINSDIFVTDVLDYVQPGFIHIYKNDGSFVGKYKTGIIPGALCFKLRIDTQAK